MPVLETYDRFAVEVFTEPNRLVDELPFVALTSADPFGIDHDCLNPVGHDFIASCGQVVCCHCAKVVSS